MTPLRYALAALLVAALSQSAWADHLLAFNYGKHAYDHDVSQMALGAEYMYKLPSALSIGVGGDYLSSDFGGSKTNFNAVRGFGGANIHFVFGCLPLDLVPGVGLEYLKVRNSPFSRDDAFGAYARGRAMLRILQELSLGLQYKKSWNGIDDLGTDWAVSLQFNFLTEKKRKQPERKPQREPEGQYIQYFPND